ncbi:putative TetR-family transcriptional regulator [Pseudonocardia autotrophica]|nr:putative TetR-family transcriptional regulator [Pseudonocardia autotrophica]
MVEPANRQGRRKARTRAALVGAARQLLSTRHPAEISIQEITDLADVGFGSLYGHFQSKTELFEVAVAEVLDEHGALLEVALADIEDPAEVFAAGVRLTGRLPRSYPQIAEITMRTGLDYLHSPSGIGPRALRDLERAHAAGRLRLEDPELALHCTAGSLIAALHLVSRDPQQADRIADELAVTMLRMFGMDDGEAREVVGRPLPTVPQDLPA